MALCRSLRSRASALLVRLAERLDPDTWVDVESQDGPLDIQYIVSLDHLSGPIERSEPIDFDYMWRRHVDDNSGYIEEEDVYRPGTYL